MIHDSIMLTHNPYAKKKYLSRTLSNSSQEQQPNEKQQPQHEIKSRSVTGQHQPQTKTPSEPLKPSIVASPLINPYLKAKKNQTVSSLSTAKPPIPMAKPKSNFSPTVLKKKKNHRHPTKTGPPENSKPQTQNDQHSNMKPTKRPCLSTTVSNCPPSGITKLGLKLESVRPSSWNTNTAKISCEKLTLQYPNNQNLSQPKSKTLIEMPGEELLPKEISYSPRDIKPINDGYRRDLLANANVKEPLLNGWTLYPHQKQAILQALVRRRMVLALDMGLGKTLIACVWAKSFKMAFDRLKVIVICPVSLKMEWKRTAENTTALVVEDENTKSHKNPLDLQIFSWAKVPTNVDASAKHYVAVFDEAHSMQSMQSARTKDALKLVLDKRYVCSRSLRLLFCILYFILMMILWVCYRCVGVLLLSGTPMKNGKPSNLFPLLKAIRHPLGRNQMAFEKHFCAGMHKSFGRGRPVWDASGCSNLKQLKRLVSSNLLHLTKDQCLSLPPLERDRYKVPISSRNQLKYIQAVKNLVRNADLCVTKKHGGTTQNNLAQ
jgi:SNF2 family DNA or RNA helicase